ncbi:TetR/AcrR family transcriptional regulator [Acidicapsa acidisoli]|uniref:TetR/AcrR family transcriptional regulator n=1 Tax=Acidicapsa acidisoli TaxID=1615681 RepID=UPI0021DF63D6|nr:helix-turn-helix domain-containing protein [Acidicapsa acidisoli]
MNLVTNRNDPACKRPYKLGKRADQSGEKREAVLRAARTQLEDGGYLSLTMDSLARQSGVTRQTVHNLFKTKTGVLEALFDQLALDGGMAQMANLMCQGMQEANSGALLSGFVRIFTGFWSEHRDLIRRIHGIAAIDPEFGTAVEARNKRRQMAATRVVDRLAQINGQPSQEQRTRQIASLYALTSFEFFDSLTESLGNSQEATQAVIELTRSALNCKP